MLEAEPDSPFASGDVQPSESWFWTDTTSTTSIASSVCSTLAFEMPIQRTFPSSCNSFSAPTDSW